VEFVLVGGVAATLHGSRHVTDDIDILIRPLPLNLSRLRSFLESVDARGLRRRALNRVIEDLAAGGTARLRTRLGALDVLGEMPAEGDFSFDALLARATALPIGHRRVHVVDLDDLIAMKEQTQRAKDLARLPELRRIRELRNTTNKS
jgi:hypothetical protein